MNTDEMLDRARVENRVLAEIASLALSSQIYTDLVHGVMDLVEQIVSSPFLSLSVQESPAIGHYTRFGEGIDAEWADEVEKYVADLQEQQLERPGSATDRDVSYHLAPPAAWIVSFAATSRSGRSAALALGCPRPLSLQPDEEQVMQRLTSQILLVLDHALVLGREEELQVVDTLTGLTNHRGLLELLEYEMQRHRYLGKRLALLMLDVEGLNTINRTYGRQYGDHILSKLAGVLKTMVRPIDVVSRCGMDEFAVVLPDVDSDEALNLAEQFRERLLALGFAGGTISLASGVAHARPDELMSAEGFLRRGEKALYEAKRQAKDWSQVGRPSPQMRVMIESRRHHL